MTLNTQAVLSEQFIQQFHQDGFLVLPNFVTGDALNTLRAIAQQLLAEAQAPLELEADLGYPGAPQDVKAPGGKTLRRLLQAYQRHPALAQWATSKKLYQCLSALFQHEQVYLSQAHHNCIMTKAPRFSSDTGWHQDIRYWSFEKPELITCWLALGDEDADNGGLAVMPGSHQLEFSPNQFDEHLFFRQDEPINQKHIQQAKQVSLKGGDVLFFHSRLLHHATRNFTNQTKLSLVFTYRDGSNAAIENTRSAKFSEVLLDPNTRT